jgi:leucyl-tRNA synthetase
VHCEKCGPVAVPEDQLPLLLPEVEKYEPTGTGESPLAAISEWVNTTCPECNGPGKRETNTMPQWGGSCWYFLRFIDPRNDKVLADYDLLKKFGPVDMYVGGAEHAVLHLLYARFWNQFLFDIGVVPFSEPFKALRHQGMILGENHQKMSKSRGNVVNPDEIISQYGPDTFRLYEMFMGPFSEMKPWSTKSIEGTNRFLQKVWRLAEKPLTGSPIDSLTVMLHKTIKKVGEDIMALSFNTAISQLMIYVNALTEQNTLYRPDFENLLRILSPFAPHLTEELWEVIGNKPFLVRELWPQYEEKYLEDSQIDLPVQINGKVRHVLSVPVDITKDAALALAKQEPVIAKWLSEGDLLKEIFVPKKMINFVVKQ